MKQQRLPLFLLVLMLALAACTATQKTSSATPAAVSTEEQDGSSVDKAIVVKSINEEYAWINKNYPGARVTSQALINKGKKHYDLLSFVTSSGEKKDVYFDINSFFGKF